MLDVFAANTQVYVNKPAIGFVLIVLLIITLAFAIWVYALFDIITNDKLKGSTTKILWFFFVFFLHGFGALIYLLFGKPKS